MKITCYKHKAYRGVRKPTSGCPVCSLVWHLQRFKKLCGLEYAKPRRKPFLGADQKPISVTPSGRYKEYKNTASACGVAGLMITADAKRELAKIRAEVPLIDVKTPSGILSADADGRVLQKKVEPPFHQCDG